MKAWVLKDSGGQVIAIGRTRKEAWRSLTAAVQSVKPMRYHGVKPVRVTVTEEGQ